MTNRPLVAVVGASGYVGRILAEHLVATGFPVRGLGRTVDRMRVDPGIDPWAVDVADRKATSSALAGVDVAYYLVHSMAGTGQFTERDRAAAQSFVASARDAGVRRIVYLGALGGGQVSEHLASRHEVGAILRSSEVPVVELRAAVILGAGSISFEMLRYLTERLPVMVCPRWVDTRLQPLAERDLLAYLDRARDVPPGVYEIGTADVTSYYEMMNTYASARGLKRRRIMRIPLLTPALSAHWVDLVTPVDRSVSHALIESLRNEVVVRTPARTSAVFDVRPLPVADAISAALDEQVVRVSRGILDRPEGGSEGVYTLRSVTPVEPERVGTVRQALSRIGGDLRWYGAPSAWRLRRLLGRLVGEQLTLRRSDHLRPGASVDWWTVVRFDRESLILATTSWFSGEGWLGYRVEPPTAEGEARGPRILQVAALRPRGVVGLAYWWLLRPVHRLVFSSMARHRAAP